MGSFWGPETARSPVRRGNPRAPFWRRPCRCRILDNGAREERVEVFQIETARRVLTLAGSGIQQVVSVQRGARVLDRSEFLWVPGSRWVSFSQRLEPRERIVIRSFASDRPDIIVANYGLERAREGSVMIFDRMDGPLVEHPSRTVSPQTEESR